MNKIYFLRYRWELVGVFEKKEEAEDMIKQIIEGNEALVKENERWKLMQEKNFIVQEKEFGLFSTLKHMTHYDGAYWVK